MKPIKHVKDVLQRLLCRMELDRPCREHQAVLLWPQIVGPQVARQTAAVDVRGGILFVRTASNVWMQELAGGLRQLYLEALNNRLGAGTIRDIRFLPPPLPRDRARTADDSEPQPRPALSPEELEAAKRLAAEVREEPIRDLLERAMTSQKALDKDREQKGWKPCARCGTLVEKAPLCIVCDNENLSERLREIHDALQKAPWRSAFDLKAQVPGMREVDYERVKRDMLRGLHHRLREWDRRRPESEKFDPDTALLALQYCMLRSGKKPHELDAKTVQWALRELGRRYPMD